MSGYQIIDEPKARGYHKFIVNPVLILLVSIVAPIVWSPPYMGKFWMPFVWIMLNSYFLGSSSFKKEFVSVIMGALTMVVFFFIMLALPSMLNFDDSSVIYPYLRLMLQAVFFITLYAVVFMQSTAYSIYSYMNDSES